MICSYPRGRTRRRVARIAPELRQNCARIAQNCAELRRIAQNCAPPLGEVALLRVLQALLVGARLLPAVRRRRLLRRRLRLLLRLRRLRRRRRRCRRRRRGAKVDDGGLVLEVGRKLDEVGGRDGDGHVVAQRVDAHLLRALQLRVEHELHRAAAVVDHRERRHRPLHDVELLRERLLVGEAERRARRLQQRRQRLHVHRRVVRHRQQEAARLLVLDEEILREHAVEAPTAARPASTVVTGSCDADSKAMPSSEKAALTLASAIIAERGSVAAGSAASTPRSARRAPPTIWRDPGRAGGRGAVI